jgi:hypothetical protein
MKITTPPFRHPSLKRRGNGFLGFNELSVFSSQLSVLALQAKKNVTLIVMMGYDFLSESRI